MEATWKDLQSLSRPYQQLPHLVLIDVGASRTLLVAVHQQRAHLRQAVKSSSSHPAERYHVFPLRLDVLALIPTVGRRARPLVVVPILGRKTELHKMSSCGSQLTVRNLGDAFTALQEEEEMLNGVGGQQEDNVSSLQHELEEMSLAE
eukprot:755738-Hanusia_phi.AAC.7